MKLIQNIFKVPIMLSYWMHMIPVLLMIILCYLIDNYNLETLTLCFDSAYIYK